MSTSSRKHFWQWGQHLFFLHSHTTCLWCIFHFQVQVKNIRNYWNIIVRTHKQYTSDPRKKIKSIVMTENVITYQVFPQYIIRTSFESHKYDGTRFKRKTEYLNNIVPILILCQNTYRLHDFIHDNLLSVRIIAMFQDPLSASNEINQHMPYITVKEININCLIKNKK